MKNKSILIFGAGENQLTLIAAARELNVRSIVIDPNRDAPGKNISDVFEVVGSNDYDKTKEIAIKYKVDGIVTSQMENPLRLMARLGEELGLTFPSSKVIENCRNKYLMKKVFLANRIPCAQGILIRSRSELEKTNPIYLKYPLIIKPVDSHSSKGVLVVNSHSELQQNFERTSSYSSDGSVLIEELIEGKEYSVEALTYQGKTNIVQYTEKVVTSPPFNVEIGHIQPASLTDHQRSEIGKLIAEAVRALGIINAATHSEIRIAKSGFKLIEIGARLGGDYISSYLTQSSTGINMDKAAIQIALGIPPDCKKKTEAYSYIKYLELPEGRIVQALGSWRNILTEENLVHAQIMVEKGDIIPPLTDSSRRPGFVIVKGKQLDELISIMNHAIEKIQSYIKLNELSC